MSRRTYEECTHIKRKFPEYVANENLSREIANNYRTLPAFEKSLYENLFIKHYSINRNELLKCRWAAYKNKMADKAPFQFPDIRHLHFHNGTIRYLPSETVSEKSHRFTFRAGPGVDDYGQKPIPQEYLQRGTPVKHTTRKIKSASKRITKRK